MGAMPYEAGRSAGHPGDPGDPGVYYHILTTTANPISSFLFLLRNGTHKYLLNRGRAGTNGGYCGKKKIFSHMSIPIGISFPQSPRNAGPR